MSVRDDLLRSGAAVVEDGERGFRLTPPSIVSLGRAVAAVRAHGVPLRVRGHGDAPSTAPAHGVLLELGSLDRIAAVDCATGLARVEAGCSVSALESAARRAGCTLGPLLPSVRSGSVGAWLAGPTRGERGVHGSRRQTAALTVSAVLADGRIAEGRSAPAKSVGPDLDRLSLGGGGRLTVIAAAWIRLFPARGAASSAWTCRDPAAALAALEQVCARELAPARARILGGASGARLALTWEGGAVAALERDRAGRMLAALGCGSGGEPGAWVRDAPTGHPVEVDARWMSLREWSREGEWQLFGMHGGGAFATLSLPEARGAEECATLARAAGARVIAPRRMRDEGRTWANMGAGGAWGRLLDALGLPE